MIIWSIGDKGYDELLIIELIKRKSNASLKDGFSSGDKAFFLTDSMGQAHSEMFLSMIPASCSASICSLICSCIASGTGYGSVLTGTSLVNWICG